eukprot:jgi/Ulvmu1/9747/UM055_0087.1
MVSISRAAPAAALCAAALLRGAAAFQIWLSVDDLPAQVSPENDNLVEAKSLVEGLVASSAAAVPGHVQSFGDVPRILKEPWDQWAPTDGAGVFEKFDSLGYEVDEVVLSDWDGGGGFDGVGATLSTGQLDQVADSPAVDDAIIVVKGFGSNLKDRDTLTPSIDHAACAGVVLEVAYDFWCSGAPSRPQLEAAKYVAASGKRLFVMPPSGDESAPEAAECMMDALHDGLSEAFFCSDQLRVVSGSPGPEAVLALVAKRDELCGGGAPAEPLPEPEAQEDGEEEDKGSVKHSSGMTAREMAGRIREQRKKSTRKVTVRTRGVRMPRRQRGSRRGLPIVADEVVAVEEDDEDVSFESDNGGVSIRVSASTSAEDDEEEDSGSSGGGGKKRTWFQCMKDCMDKCCKGMKDCMDKCCEGMKKCCEGMADCMKKCCEGMKKCMEMCCEGMKKCCEGMKMCMDKCCEGMKKCCEGMADCMKKCWYGIMAACKCMKKAIFTEEADEQEAR